MSIAVLDRVRLMVRASTVDEVSAAPSFDELLAEYAEECAIDGLPPPAARIGLYRHLESLNFLHVFAAFSNDELVGFVTVMAPELPHYSAIVAVSESFFVAKAHRHTMAGMRLLIAAEAKAEALGSSVLLVSAPYGGKLFEVLPKAGYAESSRVFCKKVTHA